MNKLYLTLTIFFLIILSQGNCNDLNSDNKVGVDDAITALQIVTGIKTQISNFSNLNWKGTWDDNKIEYCENDIVAYDGSSYICVLRHVSNEERKPTNKAVWELLAQKGEVGAQGEKGDSNFFTNGSNIYYEGNIGVGTSTPQANLHVNGTAIIEKSIKIGMSEECNENTGGQLRYNSSIKKLELCNGTKWKTLLLSDEENELKDRYEFEVAHISNGHANIAKLDDNSFIIAYTDISDRNLSPDIVKIKILSKVNNNYVISEPYSFQINVCKPNKSNGFKVMDAIGPNHFILIVLNNEGKHITYFFKRNDNTVNLLSFNELSNIGYFGGHPIDNNKYLLRYREGYISNGKVTYQLIIRDIDNFIFGNSITRPMPTEFEGLDDGEPQTFSPLIRVANNVFREIRGGYVKPPGYLSSWELSISDNNQFNISNIRVYTNSSNKTMEPIVTSDDIGNAVIIYNSYDNGWQYGYMTTDGSYHHKGLLISGSPYHSKQSRDSSEGFINDKYYIRIQSGQLYKFDEVSSFAEQVEDNLSWNYCRSAPSILSSHDFGVFLVCDGTKPLRLSIINLENLDN